MILEQKKKKPLGIILWEGKSKLDGEQIMVVATGIFGKTENRKTGEVIQTWIMRKDIDPILARRLGKDYSICGDCKLRETGVCYVILAHGPLPIFKAYHNNSYRRYQDGDLDFFKDRVVRLGTYGDPAAVPFEVWDIICKNAKNHLGYTHQWKNKNTDQRLKQYCMASVDSIDGYNKEYDQAQKMGWRTFRVRENVESEVLEGEFLCPASKEAGSIVNCEKCKSCGGTSVSTKKCPVIVLHTGVESMGTRQKYIKLMKRIKNKKKWRRNYKLEEKQFKLLCKCG